MKQYPKVITLQYLESLVAEAEKKNKSSINIDNGGAKNILNNPI